jgi:PAS domain S-box-containing protein
MRYETRADLEARLKQATKKVQYYKRIAEEAGNTRLREAEQLSQLVTKCQRTRIALQESEEKLRNIVEYSNNLFYSLTPDHILTYLSPQIEEMLGYTAEETMVKWTELASDNPINEEGFKKTVAAIESGRIQSPYELELVHKNGKKVMLEIREAPVVENGKTVAIVGAATDITERKQAEEALLKKKAELKTKAKSLKEVNTALRVLLKAREKDKTNLEEKVLSNVKDLVLPYIERIKKSSLDNIQKSCIDILESNLEEIVSPFSRKLSSKYLHLTPTEIRVANLVKEGKTTKEIAEFVNLSPRTVESHRNNIREKLGIKKSETNLRTYLLSM